MVIYYFQELSFTLCYASTFLNPLISCDDFIVMLSIDQSMTQLSMNIVIKQSEVLAQMILSCNISQYFIKMYW